MFGFLRRKKPVPPAAEPQGTVAAEQPAPEQTAVDAQLAPHATPGAPGPEASTQRAASEPTSKAPSQSESIDTGRVPPEPEPSGKAPTETVPSEAAPSRTTPSTMVPPEATLPEAVSSGTTPSEPVPAEAAPPETASAEPASAQAVLSAPPPARAGWLFRLRKGLARTSSSIVGVFGSVPVDEALFEELETALLTSDAGVETTYHVLERLREIVRRQRITEAQAVREALRALLAEMLVPLEQPIDIDRATPLVMMIAGVNGAGKTTSIGKLTHHLQREGKSVLLAAGDTFRAAAREQLAAWGARNDVTVIAQHGGDPAAVAFDAVSAGSARGIGVVIVDTAGRLPTQTHLMDELRKVRRVIGKAMEGAPHESLLVLDGNTGQNMLSQVAAFDEAVALTGLIVTKLDGTARGGALLALAHTRRERPIPVYFIGIGEGLDDLQAFSAQEFADALLGARAGAPASG